MQTVDDDLVEGTETFAVNLSNATGNATIGDATGVGTIIDNDVANVAPTADAGDPPDGRLRGHGDTRRDRLDRFRRDDRLVRVDPPGPA